MAEEAIDVRVRLVGARKAAAEAGLVAHEVGNIGDEAGKSHKSVGGFAGALTDTENSMSGLNGMFRDSHNRLRQQNGDFVTAKKLMRDFDMSATEASNALGGGGGGGGFAGATKVAEGSLSDLQGPAMAAAVVLGSYLVAGLAAVAASAVMAAAAVGALAVAAGGLFIAGMGFAALAVARFKQESDKAGTAANALKTTFQGFGKSVMHSMGPGIDAAFGGLASGLRSLRPLITALAPVATAVGRALAQAFRLIGPQLAALAPQFAMLFGALVPMIRALAPAVAPFLAIMVNLANVAMPFLIAGAEALSRWVQGFARTTGSAGALQGIIAGLMPHLQAWLSLTKQVALIFIGFVRAAAPAGLQLVQWLTKGAAALARWMNSASGQAQMKAFFAAVVPLVKEIVTFVARLAPIFIRLMIAAAPVLIFLFRALNLVLTIVGRVIGKFHTVISVITKIGGYIGVYFLGPFGATIAIVSRLAGTIRGPLSAAWGAVKSAVGTVKSAISSFISTVRGGIQWVIDRFNDLKNTIESIHPPNLSSMLGLGSGKLHVDPKALPGGASGGTFGGGGSFLVGERGPELATLGGGTVTVQPLGPSQRVEAQGKVSLGAGAGGDLVVPVTVMVPDGGVLGRTVARANRKAGNAR